MRWKLCVKWADKNYLISSLKKTETDRDDEKKNI